MPVASSALRTPGGGNLIDTIARPPVEQTIKSTLGFDTNNRVHQQRKAGKLWPQYPRMLFPNCLTLMRIRNFPDSYNAFDLWNKRNASAYEVLVNIVMCNYILAEESDPDADPDAAADPLTVWETWAVEGVIANENQNPVTDKDNHVVVVNLTHGPTRIQNIFGNLPETLTILYLIAKVIQCPESYVLSPTGEHTYVKRKWTRPGPRRALQIVPFCNKAGIPLIKDLEFTDFHGNIRYGVAQRIGRLEHRTIDSTPGMNPRMTHDITAHLQVPSVSAFIDPHMPMIA